MKVLLVVDVQRDFCPGGSLAVTDGDRVVPVINRLMREGEYDLIIASQDWHPAGHKSFASSHEGRNVFETIQLGGQSQVLWPEHCVQGTPGAEFHHDLDVELIAKVVQKGTDIEVDSYSAFRDNAKDRFTDLLPMLLEEAENRDETRDDIDLDLCGLTLDYCDLFSALDAFELGIRTRVIVDATRAVDPSEKNIAEVLAALRTAGVEITESSFVLPRIRPLRAHEQAQARELTL